MLLQGEFKRLVPAPGRGGEVKSSSGKGGKVIFFPRECLKS
jgi:hypothetical protein